MKITLLCIGRLKEPFFRDAAAEYGKRLRRFVDLEIIECPDLPEPRNASPKDIDRIVKLEGASLLDKLSPRDHVIALAIAGRQMDSRAFSTRLTSLSASGIPRAVFIIGGSNGLSRDILSRANEAFSFSPMTFPHQLARVMLLEQLYRAHKIAAGEAYHK